MKIQIPKPKQKLNRTPERAAWLNMRSKVRTPGATGYRPNTPIEPEWEKDFHSFLRDVGYKPTPKHVLKMIDPELGFVRGNVEWYGGKFTRYVPAMTLTYMGETLTFKEWSERTGIRVSALQRRFKCKWPIDQLLGYAPRQRPKKYRRYLTHNGETLPLLEWSKRTGIDRLVLYCRHCHGWTDAQALGFEPPPSRKRTGNK
jgi:hypothetical protein